MSDSLFNAPVETTPSPTEQPIASVDAFANQLFAIKNERGEPKYTSLSTALDALKHSQDYIPQLKSQNEQYAAEMARLQAELDKRASLEEQLAKFTSRPVEPASQTREPEPVQFDENTVQELVQRTLNQERAKTTVAQNLSEVRTALVAKYGDKAQEEVASRAAALGMTMEQVDAMASSAPKALLQLFSASTQTSTGAPQRSTVQLPNGQRQEGVKHPGKSLLRGAKATELTDFMRQIRDEVYKENGIDL